jgi:hypothetical protein
MDEKILFEVYCVICGERCQPSPTDDPWLDLSMLKGIHFRCVDDLSERLSGIRKAREARKGAKGTKGHEKC